MKTTSAKQERFVEICTQERRAKLADHFLHKIKECVDWDKLRETIRRRYKKNKNATENPAYDPIAPKSWKQRMELPNLLESASLSERMRVFADKWYDSEGFSQLAHPFSQTKTDSKRGLEVWGVCAMIP